jgi:hypothetical protein
MAIFVAKETLLEEDRFEKAKYSKQTKSYI